MRRGARVGWAVVAGCVASVSALLAATPPTPTDAAPSATPAAAAPAPAATQQPAEKPPTLLDVALLSADRWAIARMRRETGNLTWQMGQLAALTRLLARAGRYDQALALIENLDTPERVKVQAYAPIVVAYLRAGDKARAAALTDKVAGIEEWTTASALAEIARGMDRAGDRAGALRLAARSPAGSDRADVLFEMGRYREAIDAARGIAADTFHVDCGHQGEHCWVDDWGARQAYLVKLVKALVDQGDLRGAHEAMAALDEVHGYSDGAWKPLALVEIARREEPVATLQQAVAALDATPMMIPGDRTAHADTLAAIAEGLAAAGQRTQAIGLMPRALAVLGPTDSVETMEIWADMACRSLIRIARAELAIGRRDEGLALLQRTERLITSIPVPRPEKDADSSWDHRASTQKDRVAGRFRIAAAWEDAGEREQSERVLGDALKELAAIKNAEWRQYGWQALVEAYSDVGRLDRAMELLTAGLRGEPDRWLAIANISDEDLLAAPRPQLWGLLDALPTGWEKAALANRLAVRLDELGEQTSVSRLVTEALTSLAAMAASGEKEWQLELVGLGGELPGADRPGNAEQQRLVRKLLAALPAKAAPHAAKPHR